MPSRCIREPYPQRMWRQLLFANPKRLIFFFCSGTVEPDRATIAPPPVMPQDAGARGSRLREPRKGVILIGSSGIAGLRFARAKLFAGPIPDFIDCP